MFRTLPIQILCHPSIHTAHDVVAKLSFRIPYATRHLLRAFLQHPKYQFRVLYAGFRGPAFACAYRPLKKNRNPAQYPVYRE